MHNIVHAVLLDTRGIQKYVFSCNKLKTNIGASYLVDDIFNSVIKDILQEMGLKMPKEDWQDVEKLQLLENKEVECEIAYVGGGNMLLLVNKEDSAAVVKSIVSKWTERLLVYAPGLKTGAALGTMDLTNSDTFKASLDSLYKQLKENQNNILPEVDLPYTGLTLECDYSGKTADIKCEVVGAKERGTMISAEVDAKIRAAKQADKALYDTYQDKLDDENEPYRFVSELESIGYKDGESYISVIHIDGNNMGVKFSCTTDMQERKQMSLKVASAVKDGFSKLLQSIREEYPYNDKYIDNKKIKEVSGKALPIRPIIIGGDDVTFICPGRLGLRYAYKFIQYVTENRVLSDEQKQSFEKKLNQDKTEVDRMTLSTGLSCCAGVAIVPAKYPFFRAYELAEQLCSAAKKNSRKDDTSWLEFAVLHGEAYPSLDLMRKNQYVGAKGTNGKYRNMHYGPYKIGNPDSKHSIEKLFELQEKLRESHGDSRNKLKSLREVLFKDDHSIKVFCENDDNLRELLNKENGINVDYEADIKLLWDIVDGVETTRYLDAIEIMDFVIPELERR